ncbi:hypothetical protein ACIAD3187 [Acinetobacter baylyi ADP1]|uniref:Uncharacterized protein n=1 Tax=Acinetobacter baylyi (strain ATCC 33305 / BD413 / ADP1) TaxID=62977 RepID=Q6F7U3_ACIAD|nr:hypothetical protein ACIAD3187 [Acinetobacter baylyi ADP1]
MRIVGQFFLIQSYFSAKVILPTTLGVKEAENGRYSNMVVSSHCVFIRSDRRTRGNCTQGLYTTTTASLRL